MLGGLSLQDIVQRHKVFDKLLHSDPALRDMHRLYQLLDQKSAALFSHVSIMIAACTFLAGSPTDTLPLARLSFLVSTLLYLCIAVVLLQVLDFSMYDRKVPLPDASVMFSPDTPSDIYNGTNDVVYKTTREYFARSVKRRGDAHKRALYTTRLLTCGVILFLLFDIVRTAPAPFALPPVWPFFAR